MCVRLHAITYVVQHLNNNYCLSIHKDKYNLSPLHAVSVPKFYSKPRKCSFLALCLVRDEFSQQKLSLIYLRPESVNYVLNVSACMISADFDKQTHFCTSKI